MTSHADALANIATRRRAHNDAGDALAADTRAAVLAAHQAGMRPRDIAPRIDVAESYVYRVLRDHRAAVDAERPTVRVAYDFGDELHIMDVDGAGSYDPATVEVITYDDRNDALTEAGYETVGDWTMHGDAEGITVRRTT